MRVVAGTYKGRRLAAPPGRRTRPTADRVREALFSRIVALEGEPSDLSVLDLYAGSGALGIEAISRGAAHSTFVESDRRACETVRRNLAALEAQDRASVVCSDVRGAVRRGLCGEPFGLLFLDPPYRIRKSEVRGLVETLAARGALATGALVVWEHDAASAAEWPEGFEDLGSRVYGSARVSVARFADSREA